MDFNQKHGGKAVSSFCTIKAKYIPCHARLVIEEDRGKNICIVKHYGSHTCVPNRRGRPDLSEIEIILDTNPDITRETLIRQGVKRVLRDSGIEAASEHAQRYTDTKYIDNVIAKRRRELNPHGHNFEAVRVLQEAWNDKDEFLVYKLDDGTELGFPYVVKSSEMKVEMMVNMNMDGDHRLRETVVFLDVTHSYAKGFKTYTLSYYDIVFKSLIKVCTMDTLSESYATCKFFLETINEMIQEQTGESDAMFNPYHLKDDESGGNKLAIKEVFGEDFLLQRTSSCEYHYQANVERHAKYVQDDDRFQYFELTKDMKNATTEWDYGRFKTLIEVLIEKQPNVDAKKKLSTALSWWHCRRPRWALAFKTATLNIPLSSLAEAAHASMKSAGEKNLSLVKAVQADVTDSLRLKARWKNRLLGERSTGSGPTGQELNTRSQIRQLGDAVYYANQIHNSIDEDDSLACVDISEICNPTSSHRPDKSSRNPTYKPKLKIKRRRSLTGKIFQDTLDKVKERSLYSKVRMYI